MIEPIAVVNRLVEAVWNGGDVGLMAELFADPFDHDGRTDTVDSLVDWQRRHDQTWADTRYLVQRTVATGDSVAILWEATATHIGPWGPAEASGERLSWRGSHFFTVVDGRITALSAIANQAPLVGALGLRLVKDEA